MKRITTIGWQGLTAKQTRIKVCDIYNDNYYKKGVKVVNKQKGITILFEKTGRNKTAYGGNIYPKKAVLIQYLHTVLADMTFTSFSKKKITDDVSILGYLNFQYKIFIDGRKESVKVALRLKSNGSFHYSVDVNLLKKPV